MVSFKVKAVTILMGTFEIANIFFTFEFFMIKITGLKDTVLSNCYTESKMESNE